VNDILLTDGGMGQELIKRTTRAITPMWSADVMLHEPELVQDLHLEFIQSGARAIILNTYTATPQRLTRDASIDLLEPLHQAAKKAATDAIAKSGIADVKIIGCLPPLVASYHSNVSPDFDQCFSTYQLLVELQQDVSDIFVCETMSSITEAKAACLAAKESGKQVWVSFSVDDASPSLLRGGESLEQAVKTLGELEPDALLLNCSRPEAINDVLPTLQDITSVFGAYANGFTSVDTLYPGSTVETLTMRKDFTPEQYAQFCLSWAKQGARIIGGCCEVSPAHIRCVNDTLRDAGFKLTIVP
jgi:S-methylmethionine-dependent homocysteine/selenocysteine methylase